MSQPQPDPQPVANIVVHPGDWITLSDDDAHDIRLLDRDGHCYAVLTTDPSDDYYDADSFRVTAITYLGGRRLLPLRPQPEPDPDPYQDTTDPTATLSANHPAQFAHTHFHLHYAAGISNAHAHGHTHGRAAARTAADPGHNRILHDHNHPPAADPRAGDDNGASRGEG
jgi:hypothetical protein